MRYIGSKTGTLPWLSRLVAERAPNAVSLCDPFAGTCTVARHFKQLGMRVITGDVLELSRVIQIATVGCDAPPRFENLVANKVIAADVVCRASEVLHYLEALNGVSGYIHREFSAAGASRRQFFTPENAARIDAIRLMIAHWQRDALIDETESAFLRASLIEAADRVANTAGTYYAHLKSLSRKALLPLRLTLPPTTASGVGEGCYRADAQDVVASTHVDILYLDPPYNRRDYANYYHLPETLALGDEPVAQGRSGTPVPRVSRSNFYSSLNASNALAQLCESARANHIIVHYTTEGVISHSNILSALSCRGPVRFEDVAVRAYASGHSGSKREVKHRLYWCDVTKGGH